MSSPKIHLTWGCSKRKRTPAVLEDCEGLIDSSTRTQTSSQSESFLPPTTNMPPFSITSIGKLEEKSITKPVIVAKPPSFSRPQSVVTVIVDQEEVKSTFIVHKDLATFYSPFFAAAFKRQSPFLESSTQTMRLEDVSTSTFGLLVHWFYTQTIDLPFTPVTRLRGENILPLTHLWILAQRCLIPRLQNQIIDLLRPLLNFTITKHPLKVFFECVYEQTKLSVGEKGAELKRLAVDWMAWMTTGAALERWIVKGHLPEGMLMDIVGSLKRGHSESAPGAGKKMRVDGGGLGEAREYYAKEPATGQKAKYDE